MSENESITVESSRTAGWERKFATVGLMLATALQAADPLMVNVALPSLQREFGAGIELGAWVMTSYLCATAVTAPLTGWLRRRYGARRLFPGAMWLFLGTSLLCALAPSSAIMILLRVLQGAAGGVILPLVQAILLDIYPRERHGRMLGLLGAVFMLGPIVGPLVGGIVTDLTTWRAVFLVNLPLGLAVIGVTRSLRTAEAAGDDEPIDAVGVLLLIIAIGALQLCLERGVGRSWLASPELLAEAAAAVVAGGWLALRARYTGFAVFRPVVFRDINFAVAGFYNVMTSGLVFVVIVFLPAMSEGPLGYSATLAGSTIVPRAILLMVAMLVVGELINKINYRVVLTAGWLLMACGTIILSKLKIGDAFVWMVVGSLVQSLGAGLLFTPHSTLAYSTLAPELRTEAAGLFSLMRQLGYASGVALMTAVLRMRIGEHSLGQDLPQSLLDQATLQAYSDCFRYMAITCVAIIPGVFLSRPPQRAARPTQIVESK